MQDLLRSSLREFMGVGDEPECKLCLELLGYNSSKEEGGGQEVSVSNLASCTCSFCTACIVDLYESDNRVLCPNCRAGPSESAPRRNHDLSNVLMAYYRLLRHSHERVEQLKLQFEQSQRTNAFLVQEHMRVDAEKDSALKATLAELERARDERDAAVRQQQQLQEQQKQRQQQQQQEKQQQQQQQQQQQAQQRREQQDEVQPDEAESTSSYLPPQVGVMTRNVASAAGEQLSMLSSWIGSKVVRAASGGGKPLRSLTQHLKVHERRGESKSGRVWCATLTEGRDCERKVAVKRIAEGVDGAREAMFLSRLRHDGIVRCVEILQGTGMQYMLLEPFVERDMAYSLRTRLLRPRHAPAVARQLLRALQYLHSGGVVHGAVCPESVLVSEGPEVRLCGFGGARSVHELRGDVRARNQALERYRTHWTLCSAPELLVPDERRLMMSGGRDVVRFEAIDMFSCGALLLQIINDGNPVFCGPNPSQLLLSQLRFAEVAGDDAAPASVFEFAASELMQGASVSDFMRYRKSLKDTFDWPLVDAIVHMVALDPKSRVAAHTALHLPSIVSADGGGASDADGAVCSFPLDLLDVETWAKQNGVRID